MSYFMEAATDILDFEILEQTAETLIFKFECLENTHNAAMRAIKYGSGMDSYSIMEQTDVCIRENNYYSEGVKDLWQKVKDTIAAIVQKIRDIFNSLFGKKKDNAPPPELPAEVELDCDPEEASKFTRLVSQIIHNSMNFVDENGNLDTVKIGKALGIAIGVGGTAKMIIAEIRKKIFKPKKTSGGKLKTLFSKVADSAEELKKTALSHNTQLKESDIAMLQSISVATAQADANVSKNIFTKLKERHVSKGYEVPTPGKSVKYKGTSLSDDVQEKLDKLKARKPKKESEFEAWFQKAHTVAVSNNLIGKNGVITMSTLRYVQNMSDDPDVISIVNLLAKESYDIDFELFGGEELFEFTDTYKSIFE